MTKEETIAELEEDGVDFKAYQNRFMSYLEDLKKKAKEEYGNV